MQEEIEEFLRKNYPNTYLASEIADEAKISRSSALRQLKKLAARGKVVVRAGRYGSAGGEGQKAEGVQAKIESLSGSTGIPKAVIDDWAEEVKARSGEEPQGRTGDGADGPAETN